MKRKTLFALIFFISGIQTFAQYQKGNIGPEFKPVGMAVKEGPFKLPSGTELHPISSDLFLKPVLSHVRINHPKPDNIDLKRIKAEKLSLKLQASGNLNKNAGEVEAAAAGAPTLGSNFPGNVNSGYSPLDNSLAISNGGKIVSVANTTIDYYNTDGTNTFSSSITDFISDATIVNVCDPVVIYDSGADRFIFFAQECSGASSNSKIIICFSKTSNPADGWWLYKLTGNPAGNGTWFDYPKLAVSTNELYISGNSFTDAPVFQEAILYQIEKVNGFTGGSLNWQYWHNLPSGPATLLPVSFGQQGNYGPGIYLVSTNPVGDTKVHLFDLTDDMAAANEQLLHYTVNAAFYSPPGDGLQKNTATLLDNGDCRALSGFYLDGEIHFVFHADYIGGFNGIRYNRLNVATQTNLSTSFGLNDFDYAYPSIASFGTVPTDKAVMIGFGRTGETIFPEIRAVYCSGDMGWGASGLVKSSTSYAEYTASGGSPERWGDYTGMCRRHSDSKCWMSGMFSNNAHLWNTWIAELTTQGLGLTETIPPRASVFPNPSRGRIFVEFDLEISTNLNFRLVSMDGKIVQEIYRGFTHHGKNKFSFLPAGLPAGQYILTVAFDSKTILNEKIIIAE